MNSGIVLLGAAEAAAAAGEDEAMVDTQGIIGVLCLFRGDLICPPLLLSRQAASQLPRSPVSPQIED